MDLDFWKNVLCFMQGRRFLQQKRPLHMQLSTQNFTGRKFCNHIFPQARQSLSMSIVVSFPINCQPQSTLYLDGQCTGGHDGCRILAPGTSKDPGPSWTRL